MSDCKLTVYIKVLEILSCYGKDVLAMMTTMSNMERERRREKKKEKK